MNYWLNLSTGKTRREFQEAGAKTAGFRENNWSRAKSILPGDIFLCYLVGVKRWVGLLEVTSERYRDDSRIYEEEVFPVRFSVKSLAVLTPDCTFWDSIPAMQPGRAAPRPWPEAPPP